jgi:hypothetical protein
MYSPEGGGISLFIARAKVLDLEVETDPDFLEWGDFDPRELPGVSVANASSSD